MFVSGEYIKAYTKNVSAGGIHKELTRYFKGMQVCASEDQLLILSPTN